ncbi:cytochrome P450 2U1-like [Diadema antillarum]|uniref:cytochrome P450 2U1-like n=1 Tax=Diadema antillarum TaxID=105358 RepID=UPI003A847648
MSQLVGPDHATEAISTTTWLLLFCILFLLLVVAVIKAVGWTSAATHSTPVERLVERLPGPTGFAGKKMLLKMLKGAPRALWKETATWGKVFGIGDGADGFCFIADRQSLEEAFVEKSAIFSDRGGILQTLLASLPDRGSISNNGPAWHEAREFVSDTVKNPNFGNSKIARSIASSIPQLTSAIDAQRGEAFNPKVIFQCFFFDVFHRVAFGCGVDYDDQNLKRFIDSLDSVVGRTLNPSPSVLAFPSLSNGCLFSGFRAKLQSAARYIKNHSERAMIQRDRVGVSDSIVALFCQNIERLRRAGQATHAEPEDGWRMVFDFAFAASDTVHEVILWLILFVATRSDVQEKMCAEIRSVGDDISYGNRHRLPMVMATMLETFRLCPVAPMGVPHFASQSGSIDGYAIAKGTQLLPNLWGIHNDPEVWREPSSYTPERFLTADGELDGEKAGLVIPFSIGPRSCPGELIARMTIFHTLVTLASTYRVSLPVVGPQPRLVDEDHSFTMVPDPYKIIFTKINA